MIKRYPLLTPNTPSNSHQSMRLLTRTCVRTLALVLFLSVSAVKTAIAAPWIEPGDERTRHHLQNLVDSGVSSTLVTSWPLMWSNINHELKKINPSNLSDNALWSYQYLKHELKQAKRPVLFKQKGFLSNSEPLIRDFSSDSRHEQEANINLAITGDNSALQISVSHVQDAEGETRTIADGSHASYLFKNWMLGAGKMDRWWGPGWESSLILSHNARPAPSIFLQRNLSTAFSTPLLHWLGPWQLTTFVSQLESQRSTPNARIWGMRVNFRPMKRLEIGLSRIAMWGGKGRPRDGRTIVNMLIGRDNRGDNGIKDTADPETSNEPGNQLAGIDLRWSQNIGPLNTAFYGQFIGEDEAGGMPSRSIGLAGAELNGLIQNTQIRLSLEAKNTTVYFYETDKKKAPNVAYEHPLYKNGYRYKGNPMGASTDNDSESMSLRGQLFFRNGQHLKLSVAKHALNMDGGNTTRIGGGSIYGDFRTKTIQTQISYSAPIFKRALLTVGSFSFSNPLTVHEQKISNGAFIQLNTRW